MKSIRNKLLMSFSLILLLALGGVGTGVWQSDRRSKLNQTSQLLVNGQLHLLEGIRNHAVFLQYAPTAPDFFLEKHHPSADQGDLLMSKAKQELQQLSESQVGHLPEIATTIHDLDAVIQRYESTHLELRKALLIRGFQDFGLVGEMRQHIHQLEKRCQSLMLQNAILQIRRHEKDYLIRNQRSYIVKLRQAVLQLERAIQLESSFPAAEKLLLLDNLQRYQRSFETIVELDRSIGLRANIGLYQELSQLEYQARTTTLELSNLVEQEKNARFDSLNQWMLIAILSVFLSGTAVSLWLTSYLTQPIRQLSKAIRAFIENGFTQQASQLTLPKTNDEVGILSQDFQHLMDKLEHHVASLQDQTQKAKAADQAKSYFLQNMSHEMRTPLNGVLGFSKLLSDTSLDQDQLNMLTHIEGSASNMLGRINEILDYGELERDQMLVF
ncbi:MAG: histidine kinase dimerization/phospho-acceptor domain-containing protein, partial [Bacteroidota bacterium]